MPLRIDREGFRYWHIASHDIGYMLSKCTEYQRIAISTLTRFGYKLARVDEDRFRQAIMFNPQFPQDTVAIPRSL